MKSPTEIDCLLLVEIGASVAALRSQSRITVDLVAGLLALLCQAVRLPAASCLHKTTKTTLSTREDVDGPAYSHRRPV